MEGKTLRQELSLLLCHYMKTNFPEVYGELSEYVERHHLLPKNCESVEKALSLRYSNFPKDHFYQYLLTLRADDDFPSIFRKIMPFPSLKKPINLGLIQERHILCHKEVIYCMCIDPGSRILVTASDDYSIKIFQIPDFRLVKRLVGHEGVITNISINATCSMLLSSSHDQTIRLWSLIDGRCIACLSGFTYDIIHLAIFSPSGSMIAAACEDGAVPIWTTSDAMQGKPPCRVLRSTTKKSVAWVAFSPGGEFLAFSTDPANVTIVAMKMMVLNTLEFHQSLVDYLQFTSSFFGVGEYGPRLFTVSNDDGSICCWEIETGRWHMKYSIKHGGTRGKGKILKTCFDCEQKILVISRTNNLIAYDAISGDFIGQFPDIPITENVNCISCSPNYPGIFFIGNNSGDCALINTNTLKIMHFLTQATNASFTECQWSNNSSFIYAADYSGAVSVFKVNDCNLSKIEKPQQIVDEYLYETSEINENDTSNLICDRKGNILQEQPERIDIRDLELPVNVLQNKYLNDTANELLLVQKIMTGDHPEQNTIDNHLDIAPPLHIPISIETVQNPHGKLIKQSISQSMSFSAMSDIDQSEEASEETTDDIDTTTDDQEGPESSSTIRKHLKSSFLTIESDSDEWDLDKVDEGIDIDALQQIVCSSDIPEGVDLWPLWMTAICGDEIVYIPQIGDEVFFIREPYITLCKRIGWDSSNVLSMTVNKEAAATTPEEDLIKVPIRGSITYLESHEKGLLIKFKSNKDEVELILPVPEQEKFLVLISVYKSTILSVGPLKGGEKITCFRKIGNGTKLQTGTFSTLDDWFFKKPYLSVHVKWDEHKEFDPTQNSNYAVFIKENDISPWDIHYIGKNKTYKQQQIENIPEKIVIEFVNQIMLQEENKPFISLKDYDIETLQKIPIPMSLNLYKERLENGFYRSLQALLIDIQLLYDFAYIVFGENSKELTIANTIIDSIQSTANRAFRQTQKRTRRRNPK